MDYLNLKKSLLAKNEQRRVHKTLLTTVGSMCHIKSINYSFTVATITVVTMAFWRGTYVSMVTFVRVL